MNFASDNVTGIAPEILAAIAAANDGAMPSYGDDVITARLTARFAEIFEHEVAVFPVATGTAANSLALSALVPPWGVVYCHQDAHIATSENGAPGFFTGGAHLITLAAADGRIDAAILAGELDAKRRHGSAAGAVSLTQASEAGTLYKRAEIEAIAAVARAHGLHLHMDGARFANAVAALGCAPADITWRAGVDVLCFGATKNGALAAEAVVFFDPLKAADFADRRQRAGHLLSKMRFLSAQLEAYLADDRWLALAGHANAMARRLADGLVALPVASLCRPVEANEVFVDLPEPVIAAVLAEGFHFYRWGGGSTVRLVTAFDTTAAAVDDLLAAIARHGAGTNRPHV